MAVPHRIEEVSEVPQNATASDFDELQTDVQRAFLRRLRDQQVTQARTLSGRSGEIIRYTSYYRITGAT